MDWSPAGVAAGCIAAAGVYAGCLLATLDRGGQILLHALPTGTSAYAWTPVDVGLSELFAAAALAVTKAPAQAGVAGKKKRRAPPPPDVTPKTISFLDLAMSKHVQDDLTAIDEYILQASDVSLGPRMTFDAAMALCKVIKSQGSA